MTLTFNPGELWSRVSCVRRPRVTIDGRTDGPTDTTDRSALVVIAMIGKHVGFDTLSQVSHTATRDGATTLLDAEHSL